MCVAFNLKPHEVNKITDIKAKLCLIEIVLDWSAHTAWALGANWLYNWFVYAWNTDAGVNLTGLKYGHPLTRRLWGNVKHLNVSLNIFFSAPIWLGSDSQLQGAGPESGREFNQQLISPDTHPSFSTCSFRGFLLNGVITYFYTNASMT